MKGNNMNSKISFLRDTFLDAQKDYLEELMKDPKNQIMVAELKRVDSEQLYIAAIKRIMDIETGKVEEKNLERVETEITLILASIEDYVRERVRERFQETEETKESEQTRETQRMKTVEEKTLDDGFER